MALVVQARGDLLLAPARLDLLLDLVERPLARGRDAGDLVPDVAALDLQRIAVDADVGRERGRQQPLGVGQCR